MSKKVTGWMPESYKRLIKIQAAKEGKSMIKYMEDKVKENAELGQEIQNNINNEKNKRRNFGFKF